MLQTIGSSADPKQVEHLFNEGKEWIKKQTCTQGLDFTDYNHHTSLVLQGIEHISVYAPELLFEIDEFPESTETSSLKTPEITLEFIRKMVEWDRKNKRLKPHHFRMMFDIVNGNTQLTPKAKKYCLMNYQFLSKYGFE